MESQKTVYISYTRRADHSFCANFRQYCIDQEKPWDVQYDKTKLEVERSIDDFSQELSEAPRIIFLLSAEYFTSAYCVDELLFTYGKRAGNLLPIVVFAAGCSPNQINVKTISDFWHAQGKQADYIAKLKLAISWLLGRFDKDKNNWDTKFRFFQGESDGQTIQSVKQALEEAKQPRYKHVAADKRCDWIRSKIKEIIAQSQFEGIREQLEDYPTFPVTADLLKKKLNGLVRWLNAQEDKNHPEKERSIIAKDAKNLAGYLVLAAIDDQQMHHVTHWLNRQKELPALHIVEEADCVAQAIVTAMAIALSEDLDSPVSYRYYPSGAKKEGQILMGQGELVLHERGLCAKNYYAAIDEEKDHITGYRNLNEQMAERLGQPPGKLAKTELIKGEIDALLPQRDDWYVLLSEKELEQYLMDDFRKGLSERFPDLPQVIAQEVNSNETAQYFITGIDIGFLNGILISIYRAAYKLSPS